MNCWKKIVLTLIVAVIPSFSQATDHDHSLCASLLINKVKLVPSGREGEVFNKFAEVVREYVQPGGIFDKLGISIPQQVLQFMPGADVNAIGSVNGLPIAHWDDGRKLSNTSRSGLLYEIVISGETEHYGYYRDDNTFEEQVSIFLHASAGHQHFSHNSRFPHFRSSDRVQEAFELSSFMDKTRTEEDPEQVSLWYQYLLTIGQGQDYIYANYQTPTDLEVKAPQRTSKGKNHNLFAPTRNVLQAFVANLPRDYPEWMREMALRFERLHRFGPGLARTKIMNEGWSTFMQIILPKHGSLNGFKEAIHFCCLLSGVAAKSISNPYWLGLEAWRNIYARFQARPEIKTLPDLLSKDAAFIKYATKEIIGVMDDEMFLAYGLDQNWVVKENLAITRPYTENEYIEAAEKGDIAPPDPNNPKKNWPFSIITREYKQIIRSIINQVKGFHYQFPSPVLTSMNENGNGNVAMEMKDQVGRRVGLDKQSVAETLWVLAQIQEKPVSLEATFDMLHTFTPEPEEGAVIQWSFQLPREQTETVKKRYKITAFPNGKIIAEEVFRSGSSAPESLPENDVSFDPRKHTPSYKEDVEFGKALSNVAKAFMYNLTIGDAIHDDLFKTSGQLGALDQMVNSIIGGASLSLQLKIPTAPRAIAEYQNSLEKRMGAILKDAIAGRSPLHRRPDGVRLSVMPRIPWIRFDRNSLSAEIEATPQLPLPKRIEAGIKVNLDMVFRPGDFSDVQPVPGNDGDIVWGPNPKGGDGSGEGEEPGGNDPSEEGGEEQFEKISLDEYADALAEEVTLPHLRPKPGQDLTRDEDISGRKTKISGMAINRVILRNAFKRGYPTQAELEDGVDPFDGTNVIRRGLARLKKDQDWVVRDFEPKPAPDTNAVVFFNMDMSGSMGRFKATAKQVLFDLRAILQRKYKKVKFVYIAFNEKAYVFEDPEKFFAFEPNGGTRYSHGFEKTVELFKDYPDAQWDRFAVVTGDLDEATGPEEHSTFQTMKEGTRFTTIIRTHDYMGGWDDLANYFKAQSVEDEFVGYLDIIPSTTYAPAMLREAFKNEPK